MLKSTFVGFAKYTLGCLIQGGLLIIGNRKTLKLLISGKGGGVLLNGRSQNIINTNKWGWEGKLELAISKNKFVKRIVKTSTIHNNIVLKYVIKQPFQGKPIINTLYLHSMQIITTNAGLYSNSFSNIFEMSPSSKNITGK